MAGLGVVVAGPLAGRASAGEPYTGNLWAFTHAGGGWDPTSFCDPKGSNGINDTDPMNHYPASAITNAGNIPYAPYIATIDDCANPLFFNAMAPNLLVINGIDTETNSHDAGTRYTGCGSLMEGKPSFGALVAAVNGAAQPMAYISNGAYDYTANQVAVTRVPDTGVLEAIAFPNRMNPGDDQSMLYHTLATTDRIAATREARHTAKLAQQRLPKLREEMNTLYLSRLGQNELKQLIAYLPDTFEQSQIRRQAQVVIAAYRAGICVSANLTQGGFDTHGNHDQGHAQSLSSLLGDMHWLMNPTDGYIYTQGVADKVVMVMGSDFGRTPGFNGTDGKDHWNVTSMMIMGPGITGNRVIGGTNERHSPLDLDLNTMQPVPEGQGVRIKPGHVHKALRKLAGIDTSPIVQRFPLSEEEEINFFM
jgi:hypothetical protein